MSSLYIEVMEIIAYLKAEKTRIMTLPSVEHDVFLEFYLEIQQRLHALMSGMLTAPLDGRLSLAPPSAYTPPELVEKSAKEQLGAEPVAAETTCADT